jgi:biopolymer transport protein ExbD
MSEITQPQGPNFARTRIRSKKLSTRIDMTPMVDLAFLLLTFFVLTTSLNNAFVLEIVAPDEPDSLHPPTPINEKHVLTLILGEGDKIYWHVGISDPELREIGYSHEPVRKLLMRKKAEVENLFVLVKPADKSKYKNLVDIMDEIIDAKIERYCIVDFTAADETLVRSSLQN